MSPLSARARFATLLQREWLQHRIGWMVITAAPVAIALLLLLVGQLQVTIDDADVTVRFSQVPALALATAAIVGTGVLGFLLAWASALIQSPGLARRDRQDRSIEFWLSLPVGHAESLAAPLLAHLLLFPLAALGIGLLAGHAVSLLLVARFVGLGEWLALPWGSIVLAAAAALGRVALGLLLATLWLSPLVLMVMAASAWLKRWGLPALAAGLVLLAGVTDRAFGTPIVTDLGRELLARAARSFIVGRATGGLRFTPDSDPVQVLQAYPGWALQDGWHAIQALADPLLPLALAVSAGCFALLVRRRQRG